MAQLHKIGENLILYTFLRAEGLCLFAEELHGAASRDNLPRVLAFFNKTHELWLGRIAMLGALAFR